MSVATSLGRFNSFTEGVSGKGSKAGRLLRSKTLESVGRMKSVSNVESADDGGGEWLKQANVIAKDCGAQCAPINSPQNPRRDHLQTAEERELPEGAEAVCQAFSLATKWIDGVAFE